MKIKKLRIDNFKSLVNFELIEPNAFSVFIGANGVGKSNIFEALEYFNYKNVNWNEADELFGGYKQFVNYNGYFKPVEIEIKNSNDLMLSYDRVPYENYDTTAGKVFASITRINDHAKNPELDFHKQFIVNFSRIFASSKDKNRLNITSDKKLNFNCNNLENVLKRILTDNSKALEFKEWLDLFRPGFNTIEIINDLSENYNLQFYEKGYNKPFGKNLISDGTYNILCILASVYQNDEPQFLCIEEPENGLNPYVIKELVNFFREQCCEKGHYIWLNTHSQTLVNSLKPEEIIIINKKEGITKATQIKEKNLHGLPMDEAWLTNVLGGGVPW